MAKNKIISYPYLHSSPTAGIGKEKDNNDYFSYKVKDRYKQLAKKIKKKGFPIYRKGRFNNKNPSFFIREPTGRYARITDLLRFIKEAMPIRRRGEITEDDVPGIINYWKNPDYEFTTELPDQDTQYVLMLNGNFDMNYGKFRKFKPLCKDNLGYRRFVVNATYVKETPDWVEDIDPVMPSLVQLVTGIAIQRRFIWLTRKELRIFFITVLEAVLPESGAYQCLPSSANKSDYQDVADSDCHCVIVRVDSASELTNTFWDKLKVLADKQKPVLILADFLPFLVRDDSDKGNKCNDNKAPDGKDNKGVTLAKYLQKHLYIEPESMPISNLPTEITDEIANILVSSALRKLFLKINSVEPDICPEVDAIFARPDPNNIPEMIEWYIKNKILHTEINTDVIQVKEFAERLKAEVIKSGGDGKNYTPNGIGMRLKKLSIKTTEQKLATTKGKVSVLVGYKLK